MIILKSDYEKTEKFTNWPFHLLTQICHEMSMNFSHPKLYQPKDE